MRILFESPSITISSTLSPKNTPRIDGVFFASIKDAVLGKGYELSLVFIGKDRARALNKQHRKKDYATDILSFPLAEAAGEIFIYPPKAKQKAKDFDRTFANYLHFLFLHGLVHLAGHDHETEKEAEKMEAIEEKWRKKFGI